MKDEKEELTRKELKGKVRERIDKVVARMAADRGYTLEERERPKYEEK